MLRFISIGAIALLLAGCVYIPPVWDVGDAINDVDKIKVGVSTKEEVLKKLGQPNGKDVSKPVFQYSGEQSSGFLILRGRAGLVREKYWWVEVEFNEKGVVNFLWSSEFDENQRAELKFLCHGARLRSIVASTRLSQLYFIGREPLGENFVQAYKWYLIAKAHGSDELFDLSSYLTAAQLAEGKRLATEWTPESSCP